MTTLMELNDICLQQGDFSLRVPRLCLQPGVLYSLKGENGAGKSTLLRLLALLQVPQSGTFSFVGHLVCWREADLQQLRKHVTLLEQTPLLFTGSVEKNLTYGLKLRGFSGRELQQRIDEALEVVGLRGFNHRSVKELSGGEVRRTGLARALCLKPKLLLLDEPTANLDIDQVAALERFLVGLPRQGMTVVVATHDRQQPERFGGNILQISKGELQQVEQHSTGSISYPTLKSIEEV